MTAPANMAPPQIVWSVGDRLTVSPPPGEAIASVQWKRSGVAIQGATAAKYVLTANEADARITAAVVLVAGVALETILTPPVASEDTDNDDDEVTPPVPLVALTAVPAGLLTTASPAVLSASLGLAGANSITVTVQTTGAAAPAVVTYAYSVTGQLIVVNTVAGAGVQITAASPATAMEAGRGLNSAGVRVPGLVNGMEANIGLGGPVTVRGMDGGFDKGGRGKNNAFDGALNICPTATGLPLTYPASGGGATLSKFRSIPTTALPDPASKDGNWRPQIQSRADVLIATTPLATGRGLPFLPAPGNPNRVPQFYAGDIDMGILPNLPVVGPLPDLALAAARLQVPTETTSQSQIRGERFHPADAGSNYRSDRAREMATAALACCLNIDPEMKRRIFHGLVQIGIHQVQFIADGGRFNNNDGLGGISAGSKFPIVLAALATGNAALIAMAQRLDYSSEDRQVVTVDQADVDDFDYVAADLGMPEWQMNEVQNPLAKTRLAGGVLENGKVVKTYRTIFHKHIVPQTLALRLITGGRAMWGNQRVFDYADRIMIGNWFRDGSPPMRAFIDENTKQRLVVPYGDAVNTGYSSDAQVAGGQKPDDFTRAMHTAYRTRAGTGAVWAWG